MTTQQERAAIFKTLAHEDAVATAVLIYSKALTAQLETAAERGGWPEKITLTEPRTPAETEALNLVLAHLEKQLPGTKITLT